MGESNKPHDSDVDEGTPQSIPSLKDTGEAASQGRKEQEVKSPGPGSQVTEAAEGKGGDLPSPIQPEGAESIGDTKPDKEGSDATAVQPSGPPDPESGAD